MCQFRDFLIAINACLLLWTTSPSFGQSNKSQEVALYKAYQDTAFVREDGRLFRFENKSFFVVNTVCTSTYCKSIDQTLIEAELKGLPFRFTVSENLDSTADVNIIVVNKNNPRTVSWAEVKKMNGYMPSRKFFSEGTNECSLFSILSPEKHRVEQMLIRVADHIPDKKFKSCLTINFMRGSGFLFKNSYDQAWSTEGDLNKSTSLNRKIFTINSKLMLGLHFSKLMKPGMTRGEFETITRTNSADDILRGIPNE